MESNLDDILPIAYRAAEWGAMISFSSYCSLKNDNDDEMVRQGRYAQLIGIIKEIRRLKGALGHIKKFRLLPEKNPRILPRWQNAGLQGGLQMAAGDAGWFHPAVLRTSKTLPLHGIFP